MIIACTRIAYLNARVHQGVGVANGGGYWMIVTSGGAVGINTPSMRKPVGVKWVVLGFRWAWFFFSRVVTLSPSFHPHSQ